MFSDRRSCSAWLCLFLNLLLLIRQPSVFSVDPKRIADSSSLNKFAPGWAVNLPMSCRVVGDPVEAYAGAHTTALPMTVRAGDDAPVETEVELQMMLTRGDFVKGKPHQGMEGNYFARRVRLKVE